MMEDSERLVKFIKDKGLYDEYKGWGGESVVDTGRDDNSDVPLPLLFLENIIADPSTIGLASNIRANVLYQHFREWCESNGRADVPSLMAFGCQLRGVVKKARKSYGMLYNLETAPTHKFTSKTECCCGMTVREYNLDKHRQTIFHRVASELLEAE